MKRYLSLCLVMLCSIAAMAQEQLKVHVADGKTHAALANVALANGNIFLAQTDSVGNATLHLAKGSYTLTCSFPDYETQTVPVSVPAMSTLQIDMSPVAGDLEEVVVLSTTRNNERMENSPMKVEVLGKEELSEEAGIKPGNIASLLGDVSGVQIQQLSATSGNANVRIQGLDGRYTQLIRDGMPLYDGFSGGFGILTLPPLDLQQIELVKGSASTLYGGGAIGGLINLLSRRPTFHQEADVVVNYTSLKEFNVNAFIAKRSKKVGYTLFAGYNNQQAVDVDGDGFSDVPTTSSFVVHPRLFLYPSDKTIITVGYTGTFDNRIGGDMKVLANETDALHQYYERNITQRHTGEYIVERFLGGDAKLTFKGNISNFDRNTESNTYGLHGNQTSFYDEASCYIPMGKNNLVAGINIVGDHYQTLAPDTALLKSFANFTTGIFGQYSLHLGDQTTIETGMRLDNHATYGLFALPRIAFFHRFNDHWASRAGFGMGYKTPNPLVQQNIEYNIIDIMPLSSSLKPELSYGYNAEVNYKKEWDAEHTLFVNQAFFLTQIDRSILFQTNQDDKIGLVNSSKPVVSKGFDTYVKLKLADWEVYLGYTYTNVNMDYTPTNGFAPLTPRNRTAFVLVREIEKIWRFGLEGSYVGKQFRYDGTTTPNYVMMALMIQRNLGKKISIVLNCENLLDYRMSRVEQLYVGSISDPVFKPLWAPIDGRIVNLSLRWKL